MKKRILISGAGVAGLSLALLLDKNKYEIKILERSEKFNSKGFAIVLWESGYEVAKEALGDIGRLNVESLNKATFYGGEDLEFLHDTDITGVGHSVERKDLIDALSVKATEKNANIEVKFSTFIREIRQNSENSLVTLSNEAEEEYDLVVLADGMHSQLRNNFFKTKITSRDYQITYEWIYDCPSLKNEIIYGYLGNTSFLIQTVKDKALIGYYNSGETQTNKHIKEQIINLINRKQDSTCRLDDQSSKDFSVETVEVDKAYDGRLVLIGDAFHGHSPTMALGTSAALEDAKELADRLNEVDSDEFDDNFEGKLSRYENSRKDRIKALYNFQNLVEKLVMSDNHSYIEVVKILVKMIGKYPLEFWLRHLVEMGKHGKM